MQDPPVAFIALALAALALTPTPGFAAPPGAAFTGTWTYVEDAQETKRRQAAIEAATQDLSVFVRGQARERLRTRTTPPPLLKLVVDGEQLELTRGAASMTLGLGGAPKTVEVDGDRAVLSARLEGDRIVVTSQGDNGERVSTYTLASDTKHLTVSVRLRGERLGQPIVYRETYVRR